MLINVLHLALALPLAYNTLGEAIRQLDTAGTGSLSVSEAHVFFAQLVQGLPEDAGNTIHSLLAGDHLSDEARTRVRQVLLESQMLGIIVLAACQESETGEVQQDSFEDLALDMMANQASNGMVVVLSLRYSSLVLPFLGFRWTFCLLCCLLFL